MEKIKLIISEFIELTPEAVQLIEIVEGAYNVFFCVSKSPFYSFACFICKPSSLH